MRTETAQLLVLAVLGSLAGLAVTMGAWMVDDGHMSRGLPVMASA